MAEKTQWPSATSLLVNGLERAANEESKPNNFTSGKSSAMPFELISVKSKTSDEVSEIYLAYPRHVAARAAKKAIQKAIERVMRGEYQGQCLSYAQAVAGIKHRTMMFADSASGNRGSFTPHPATWFNRSSYLDDPVEWGKVDEQPSKTTRRTEQNRAAILEGLGLTKAGHYAGRNG